MKKRVLIMSAGAGTGHIKAAEALELSFAADGRVAEVINNDALQYTNKFFQDFYSSFYTSLVRSAPNFLITAGPVYVDLTLSLNVNITLLSLKVYQITTNPTTLGQYVLTI